MNPDSQVNSFDCFVKTFMLMSESVIFAMAVLKDRVGVVIRELFTNDLMWNGVFNKFTCELKTGFII